MIVTVTPNPLLDYILHSQSIPEPGGKRSDRIPFTVGGKGINVARMLKTLGRPALALSFAGGENGRKIRWELVQQGIATELIETQAETRLGINLVVEEPIYHTWWIENGEELQRVEVDNLISQIEKLGTDARFVAMSGTIPGRRNDDLYLRIIRACKPFQAEIYLDARGLPLKEACNAGGFFLKHNRDEAIETFSLDPFDITRQKDFIALLNKQRIWGALITNGKSEALLWDGEKVFELWPAPAKEISSVGCGDATLAGMLFGRSQGLSLLDSARWGMAAGAADAEKPGPCEADYSAVVEKLPLVRVRPIESAF